MPEKKQSADTKTNRLFKSRKDKMIDGVCGGLAEYIGVDVTVVRILWVVSVFLLHGVSVIAYILAMIFVPVNPEHADLQKKGEPAKSTPPAKDEKAVVKRGEKKGNAAIVWGAILIIVGFFFLIDRWGYDFRVFSPFRFRYFPFYRIPWDIFWPSALILVGIVYVIVIVRRDRKKSSS